MNANIGITQKNLEGVNKILTAVLCRHCVTLYESQKISLECIW